MMRRATELLLETMERARDENPRGDLYRTLPTTNLLARLKQNVAELEISYEYGIDRDEKLADVANYCAFLLHNLMEPPT